jgi:hypothetical protein
MTKVTIPQQNIHMDSPTKTGIEPIWYDKLKSLIDKVNSLDLMTTAGGYQTGVWTPVLTSAGGTPPTFTATPLTGTYTKIGNLVIANFIGVNSAGGTAGAGAQQLSISLPFPNLSTIGSTPWLGSYAATTNGPFAATIAAGASVAALYKLAVSGAAVNFSALTGADFAAVARSLQGTIIYGS